MIQNSENTGYEMMFQEIEELIKLLKRENELYTQNRSLIYESTQKSSRLAMLLDKATDHVNFKHLQGVTDQFHWQQENVYIELINNFLKNSIDFKDFDRLFNSMFFEINDQIYADINKAANIDVDEASFGFQEWIRQISNAINDLRITDSSLELTNLENEKLFKTRLRKLVRSRYNPS